MSELKLRLYQEDILIEVYNKMQKGVKRIMVSSPTGSGKTIMFSVIAKKLQKENGKVLVITHRKELLFQSDGTFEMLGINAHSLTAKTKHVPDGDIVVAMVETLFRRLKDREEYEHFLNEFDMIIIDEGHVGNFDKLFRYIPDNIIVIAWSATPYRKGTNNALSDFYEELVQGVDVPDLIMQGFLAKPHTFGMKVDLSRVRIDSVDYNAADLHQEYQSQRVYDGVIKNYKKYCAGKKAILFAASVESSRDIMIKLNNAGIRAAHVDANTPDQERRITFEMYRNGEYKILCNVGIITMGFDDPDTEVIILYRATKSLPLFLQMVGRGSRITETKKDFTILDFGQNTDQHGFWEQPRMWSLDNDTTRFRRESGMTKECPECGELNSIGTTTCRNCGYVWERERREELEEIIIADLQAMDGFNLQLYSLGKTFEELEIIKNYKGYKDAWMYHQLESLDDLQAFGRYKGYKPGWFHFAKRTFKAKTREQREEDIRIFKERLRLEAQR